MNDTHEVQIAVEQARDTIRKAEALVRLENNPDFKEIIIEDYLNEEAIRLVHAKADPALAEAHLQGALIREMDAIGSFIKYLRKIRNAGVMAENTLMNAENLSREE